MKKRILLILASSSLVLCSFISFSEAHFNNELPPDIKEIVKKYKQAISQWPKPQVTPGVAWEEFQPIKRDFNYFEEQDKPMVILGKMLFFDPKLSQSNQISCSSCHDPEIGWGDQRRTAIGNDHLLGVRNTLSLFNVAERKTFFWDGRAATLEEQVAGPLNAHNEMAMDVKALPAKIQKVKGYLPLFKNAYGDSLVTYPRIVRALAAFQKTIKSQPSRFDDFLEGQYDALTDQEIYGMHLFRTKARCMNCHSGQYLTDEKFHNIGLTYYKRKYQDLGLYNLTKNPDDVGKFRTPQLRDLLLTRPWMHNGLFNTLEGIVNMYNSGMHMIDPSPEEKAADPNYPITDSLLQPLELSRTETQAIVAFLKALSDTKYKMRRPDFPRE